MTYQQTLDYLYAQLPMFQRIGVAAYKADLNNTIAICNLLDNPQHKFKSIHIAGTNGKGSTSHMLASILQTAGYKVGLYTSPHLIDFRERIKINGEMIPQNYVVDFVAKYKNEFEKIAPSFFEMTVGLAFDFFAYEKVDIAIVEVGLGGRLDSTNVLMSELSIITNISFDHVALLGDTLEKIAIEKAGIIKPNTPVVIGETQEETESLFKTIAKKNNSDIYFADTIYHSKDSRQEQFDKLYLLMNIEKNGKEHFKKLKSELLGHYQQRNISAVLCAIDILKQKGFTIENESILEGIQKVISNTGLLGRWQLLSQKPLVIADTGHNEAGIKEVLNQISLTKHTQLHFVLGMVNDKDITKILNLLPKTAIYYFCKASIPRALDADELMTQASKAGLIGQSYKTVKEAVQVAKSNSQKEDLIFIGGSTFTVADALLS